MKNILAGLFLTLFLGVNAMAAQETTEKGYQVILSSGIVCTSGTAVVELTSVLVQSTWSALGGFSLAGYRIQNQDAAYSIWVGGSAALSTSALTPALRATLGEKLIAGANGVWPVSQDMYRESGVGKPVKLFCRAENAAGATGVVVSITAFGYR